MPNKHLKLHIFKITLLINPLSNPSLLHSHLSSCVCAKSLQLYPILCDPMDCSLPGSSIKGILQASILEWVATSFSRASFHSGIKPRSPALQVDSLLLSYQGSLYKYIKTYTCIHTYYTMEYYPATKK